MNCNHRMAQWILILGDLVVLLIFFVMGKREHNMEISLGSVLTSAYPFLIAWLVIGFIFGVFNPERYRTWMGFIIKTLSAWVIAGLLGMTLRSLILWKQIDLQFTVVVIVFNLVTIAIWRLIYMLVYARKKLG
jgi:hypothetical protein